MTTLDPAVELLDRALSYTRVILSEVTDPDLSRPTPCTEWDLGQLLAHMEDALDAFTEGAHGSVELDARLPVVVRVANLRRKACALLAAWSSRQPAVISIGEHTVDTSTVVLAAALEITVHGWDVGQSLGSERRIPDDLARRLLPVAQALVADADRGDLFGTPRPVPATASAEERLVGHLGRDARLGVGAGNGSSRQITGNRSTGDAAAS